MLERLRDLLDGTDFSAVRDMPSAANGERVSGLETAHMKKGGEDDTDSQKHHAEDENALHRPKADYYSVRTDTNPFPIISSLNPADSHQHGDSIKAVGKVVDEAMDNGFPTDKLPKLCNAVIKNIILFRTSFSFGPPARFPLLMVKL